MCFSKKYKQRIAELEREIIEHDKIIQALIDDIEKLNEQVEEFERKENGKYSLYLLKVNGEKWFDEAMGMEELVKATGISRTALMNSLNKCEPLKGSRNAKYDPQYIGSQVVSVDNWYKSQSE